MSMQVIDEDHYTHEVVYDAGRHVISREQIGTRYVATPMRILVDPNDPADLSAVHSLQDAIEVEQGAVGSFEIPDWDPVSQKTVRDALVTLATTLPDTKDTFGSKDDTDPVRHLIGSANAWGGNPQKDALYLTVVPQKNDGSAVHRLTVGEVPVDGFWSSPSTTRTATWRRTRRTPTRSTTSPRARIPTAAPRSSSAAATVRRPTAYRSRRDGTTPSGCIGRIRRSSTDRGSSRTRNRSRGPARSNRRSCVPAGPGVRARHPRVGSAR